MIDFKIHVSGTGCPIFYVRDVTLYDVDNTRSEWIQLLLVRSTADGALKKLDYTNPTSLWTLNATSLGLANTDVNIIDVYAIPTYSADPSLTFATGNVVGDNSGSTLKIYVAGEGSVWGTWGTWTDITPTGSNDATIEAALIAGLLTVYPGNTQLKSTSMIARTCAAPTAPTNLSPITSATGVSLNPVLSWDAVAGATSYHIYFGETSTPYYASTSETTYQLSGLDDDTEYGWYVLAVNDYGASEAPSALTFTTSAALNSVPLSPSGLTSLKKPTFVWVNVDEDIQNRLLIIEKLISGAYAHFHSNAGIAPSAESYALPVNLDMGETYRWKLVNQNIDGEFINNNNWLVFNTQGITDTTLACPSYTAPTNGSTWNVGIAFYFQWTTVIGAISYYLYIFDADPSSETANIVHNATISSNYYLYTPTSSGTFYWFIDASDGTNSSDSCTVYSFTVQATTFAGCPTYTIPAASVGGVLDELSTSFTLTYTPDAITTHMRVYIKDPNDNIVYDGGKITVSGVQTAAVSGLQYGTIYTAYYIPWSNGQIGQDCFCQFITEEEPVPSCPTTLVIGDVTLVGGVNSVSARGLLTWTAMAGATGYYIYVGKTASTMQLIKFVGGTTLEYQLSLEYGITYYIRVSAYNAAGENQTCTTYQLLTTALVADTPATCKFLLKKLSCYNYRLTVNDTFDEDTLIDYTITTYDGTAVSTGTVSSDTGYIDITLPTTDNVYLLSIDATPSVCYSIYEFCGIESCMENLIRVLICSDVETCQDALEDLIGTGTSLNCGELTTEQYEEFRNALNKIKTLYDAILQMVNMERVRYLGVYDCTVERTDYLSRVGKLIKILNYYSTNCGICYDL